MISLDKQDELNAYWCSALEWRDVPKEVGQSAFKTLVSLYSDHRRKYHNLNHVYAMLKHLEACGSLDGKVRSDLIVATFFHDSFYTFCPGWDEDMSCNLFTSMLWPYFDKGEPVHYVVQLINCTAGHHQLIFDKNQNSTNNFINADLSILGSHPDVYDNYSKQIFEEFKAFHPVGDDLKDSMDELFFNGRAQFLSKMLSGSVFKGNSRYFLDMGEQARNNMRRELSDLNEKIARI